MNLGTPRIAVLGLCIAAAVGLGLYVAKPDTPPAPVASPAMPTGEAVASGSAAMPATSAPTTSPRSIEDAARLLELGVAGDLSIDMHTRGALDIVLASLGATPTPADFQRLEDALRRSLPGEAATQAMGLVRRYAAYTQAAATDSSTQQAPATPEELKALLDKSIALRRQHFDPDTARALFGAEEEQTRLDLALQAIEADPRLSPQEKLEQARALNERGPRGLPGLQAPIPAAQAEMESEVAALRQQGATAAQIEQARTRHLGADSARALAETEAARDDWESRYQAYALQKKTIVATAAPDMAAQLEAALRQHFSEEELHAARAYDRARDSTRTP